MMTNRLIEWLSTARQLSTNEQALYVMLKADKRIERVDYADHLCFERGTIGIRAMYQHGDQRCYIVSEAQRESLADTGTLEQIARDISTAIDTELDSEQPRRVVVINGQNN